MFSKLYFKPVFYILIVFLIKKKKYLLYFRLHVNSYFIWEINTFLLFFTACIICTLTLRNKGLKPQWHPWISCYPRYMPAISFAVFKMSQLVDQNNDLWLPSFYCVTVQ